MVSDQSCERIRYVAIRNSDILSRTLNFKANFLEEEHGKFLSTLKFIVKYSIASDLDKSRQNVELKKAPIHFLHRYIEEDGFSTLYPSCPQNLSVK